ncbi:ISAs1 family transposase [Bremerella alba]|uniref:ISAs1 family transposase n=1 Tax=Bremerella alba TaxID=980252 RepID=UPI0028F45AF3|nr:ISAs1 family transposase [Bremerella alba]
MKKNQETLFNHIASEFEKFGEENYRSPKCRAHWETRKTRGRLEERIVYVAAAPRSLKETGQWADLKTIGMVYRHREADPNSQRQAPEPTSSRVTFFISSLPPKAKQVAKYVHAHWSVENSLHWTLDVTFTEDSSRVRQGSGPEILASLRRVALTLLKRDTSKRKMSIRLKRKVAGWSQQAMEAIILGS